MVKNFIEAERDQDADCARIEAAVRLAERDIAFLDERPLDPEEKREKWCTIRDRTILPSATCAITSSGAQPRPETSRSS